MWGGGGAGGLARKWGGGVFEGDWYHNALWRLICEEGEISQSVHIKSVNQKMNSGIDMGNFFNNPEN